MIEGLITAEVASYLTERASQVEPPDTIVELGSYKGKSTVALAARTRATVYAVEPHTLAGNATGRFGFAAEQTQQEFLANTRPYSNIEYIQAFSVPTAHEFPYQVGLLYVDGDHRKAAVVADWQAWLPNLSEHATVVFDDYISETGRSPGVQQAVDELGLTFELVLDRLAVVRL